MRTLISALLLALPCLASADGYGFMTPSGNIYCNGSVEASQISCSIINRTAGPPALPRPFNCSAMWGHVFNLGPIGPATLSCSNPPRAVNYTDIAPYGVSANFGAIFCQSESTGLTCTNPQGHGFFLSRRQQSAF